MKLFRIWAPGYDPVPMPLNPPRTLRREIDHFLLHLKNAYKGEHTIRVVMTETDQRCLVVVNPNPGLYSGRRGCFEILDAKGIYEIIYAYGDSGFSLEDDSGTEVLIIFLPDAPYRLDCNEHLVLAMPGAEFRLDYGYAYCTPKNRYYWYTWDGDSWLKETPEKRDLRLASMAKVEAVDEGRG